MSQEYLAFTQAQLEQRARDERLRRSDVNAVEQVIREFNWLRPKRNRK